MIVYSCGHPPAMVTSVKVIAAVASQLSVPVAEPVLAGNVLAVHKMVIFAGHVMAGARLSSITITWLQVEKLPQSSCDFQVRVMVYSCGQAPAVVTSVNVIVNDASQLSFDVGDPVLAGNVLAVQSIVTLAGHVIVGATISTTVITWVQDVVFPHSSVAVHVRVMVLF